MSLDSHTPTRSSLAALFATDDFVGRHIGPTPAEQAHMLQVLGVGSLDELLDQTVPAAIRLRGPLALPDSRTVPDVLAELTALARDNAHRTSLIGQGYYGTITPPVIQRNVLENPPGTRRTRRTSPRSARGGSRPCSTSRR
jgi:glycine dehydrogenase